MLLFLAVAAAFWIDAFPKKKMMKAAALQPPAPVGYALPVSAPSTVPTPVVPIPAKATPESNTLSRALEYSRSLAARRVVQRGTVAPVGGGYSASFEYELRDNLERIQIVGGGNFVRRAGGRWARTHEWSLEGEPVSEAENALLSDLLRMCRAPWDAVSTAESKDLAGSEPLDGKILYRRHSPSGSEYLFALRQTATGSHLERFSGPVQSGRDQVQLTLDLIYPPAPFVKASSTPARVRRLESAPIRTKNPGRKPGLREARR